MTALSADRLTLGPKDGNFLTVGVAAAKKIYAGAIVMMNSSGYATPGAVATGLVALGRAEKQADNSGGADNAITVKVRKGIFAFASGTSADAITIANRGATVYAIDDQTVGLTSGSSTRSVVGTVYDVDSDGVWVKIS